MRIPHKLPGGQPSGHTDGTDGETIADKLAIIAQKYAGFFTGKVYRFDQQAMYAPATESHKGIRVSKKDWKEPVVMSDDCDFCKHTTDERVVERIAGYQHQIDIEVLRGKATYYSNWLKDCGPDVIEREWVKDISEPSGQKEIGKLNSAANRRRFCELFQDIPRETSMGNDRPDGWERKPLPIVNLPLRLKRKLCIEWNHVYRDYLAAHPDVIYDFEARQFFRDMPELGPLECCGGVQVWNQYEKISAIHKEDCEVAAQKQKEEAERTATTGQFPHGYWTFGAF